MIVGSSDCFFAHKAVAKATLATFSTVNSSAIIALQPSVPNLIFVAILYFFLNSVIVFSMIATHSNN